MINTPSLPHRPEILVFARAPIPGRAKTRLIPAVGPWGAARIHTALVSRTVTVAAQVRDARVTLCAASSPIHPFLAGLARCRGVAVGVQRGGDLGRRMSVALARALREAPYAELVGSDCPELQTADLEAAIQALADGADAVLGPALDGGYWLIGLRRPADWLFHGVDWGTGRVLAQTRAKLRHRGWRWLELAARADLDRPADLLHSGFAPWRCRPRFC
jgi:rSAM/selenodomain-associated transferase 1